MPSLLKGMGSVGGVSNVVAWVRAWRGSSFGVSGAITWVKSNFDESSVGSVGQNFELSDVGT